MVLSSWAVKLAATEEVIKQARMKARIVLFIYIPEAGGKGQTSVYFKRVFFFDRLIYFKRLVL
jgi:hypothetical protein